MKIDSYVNFITRALDYDEGKIDNCAAASQKTERGEGANFDRAVVVTSPWQGKATVAVTSILILDLLLYFALPICVAESHLSALLYACVSILVTSVTFVGTAHYRLRKQKEKERDRLDQMSITIVMETVQREALESENASLLDFVGDLQEDKLYLEKENTNLWREISTLQSKVDSLESCLQRITDSDSSDESDDEEDENVMDCNRCIICMERERNIVTAPCRHLCLCSHCVRRVKHCPLCRKKIKKPVRVFSE